MKALLSQLSETPRHFPDCCAALSHPLLTTLLHHLPSPPALILSIGSGSGLLETLLFNLACGSLNIYGVEVPSCANTHLPRDRVLRVSSTESLHPQAVLASTLIFVYPRQVGLVVGYLEAALGGALEGVVWFGHRSDWVEYEDVLRSRFDMLEVVEGPGLAAYEVLVLASLPRGERVDGGVEEYSND
ncbi:hypothetical protein B0A50_07002 [Salinomyces thailandicus]|uniref:Uncharacterized protein n=1 Tax=Salinomyces thailandicus TaxID=706561 RepID=A0A4U0TPH6_9PEZI|nr:hypothetical protein B0A50_07002 [Salinomyces thailandica]